MRPEKSPGVEECLDKGIAEYAPALRLPDSVVMLEPVTTGQIPRFADALTSMQRPRTVVQKHPEGSIIKNGGFLSGR